MKKNFFSSPPHLKYFIILTNFAQEFRPQPFSIEYRKNMTDFYPKTHLFNIYVFAHVNFQTSISPYPLNVQKISLHIRAPLVTGRRSVYHKPQISLLYRITLPVTFYVLNFIVASLRPRQGLHVQSLRPQSYNGTCNNCRQRP